MNGETDVLFENGFRFIEQLDVSQLHAFPYSERANTMALEIKGVVPVAERKLRTQRLIRLSEQKTRQFYTMNLGRTATVLFENNPSRKVTGGWTENYIKVEVPYQPELLNRTRLVILNGINGNGAVNAGIL
jgi:threonylcarbamoyladenosine tRNA methylthiotransferase MtaB